MLKRLQVPMCSVLFDQQKRLTDWPNCEDQPDMPICHNGQFSSRSTQHSKHVCPPFSTRSPKSAIADSKHAATWPAQKSAS